MSNFIDKETEALKDSKSGVVESSPRSQHCVVSMLEERNWVLQAQHHLKLTRNAGSQALPPQGFKSKHQQPPDNSHIPHAKVQL